MAFGIGYLILKKGASVALALVPILSLVVVVVVLYAAALLHVQFTTADAKGILGLGHGASK